MAEGWLRHLAGDRFQVFSAGSHPSRVHPLAIRVMEEVGIDIHSQTSDFVDDYLDRNIDVVITVCDSAREVCPVFPGNVIRIHWSIDDPFRGWSENPADLPRYRKVRDELRNKIGEWIRGYN